MNVMRNMLRASLASTSTCSSSLPLFASKILGNCSVTLQCRHYGLALNQSINGRSALLTPLLTFSRALASKTVSKPPIEPEVAAAEEQEPVDGESGKPRGVEEYDPKDRTKLITWEVSAKYLKSQAYKDTYGNDPVWKSYRRQHKGQIPRQFTRRTCIRYGRIKTGSPCPGCRDEYLVFDYRNTELLRQFLSPFTGERLDLHTIGLCLAKRNRLDVELEKARYFGTMEFKVPFRRYNYEDYYGKSLPTPASNHSTDQS